MSQNEIHDELSEETSGAGSSTVGVKVASGFACEDVHAEAERLVAHGLQEVDLPRQPNGRRDVAFFHPRSTGGILTELVPARAAILDTPRVHRSR